MLFVFRVLLSAREAATAGAIFHSAPGSAPVARSPLRPAKPLRRLPLRRVHGLGDCRPAGSPPDSSLTFTGHAYLCARWKHHCAPRWGRPATRAAVMPAATREKIGRGRRWQKRNPAQRHSGIRRRRTIAILFHRKRILRSSSRHGSYERWWTKPLSEHARKRLVEAPSNTCLTQMAA